MQECGEKLEKNLQKAVDCAMIVGVFWLMPGISSGGFV